MCLDMPISIIKSKICIEFVFSKNSSSDKAVKYKLRIALYALHEKGICSTLNGQLHVPQYS